LRYLMLIYSREVEGGPSPEEDKQIRAGHAAVMGDAMRRGIFLGAEKLAAPSTATTVRMGDGKTLITDGPFAETKEQLAGYYMLECRDLDDAIEWAARIPTGCQGNEGCIEIRPLPEFPPRVPQRPPDPPAE